MKICITGGAGMIGSALAKKLIMNGHDLTIIDNLWRGKIEHINTLSFDINSKFHNIDLSKQKNISTVSDIFFRNDAIIHLADIVAGIGYVFNNQYDIFRINNLINTNTFLAAKESGVKQIIYAGTACSFPKELQNSLYSILKEEQLFPSNPESLYGWSKLVGSLELNALKKETNINATTLLLHNVFGPNCDWKSERSQVIPSLINKLITAESEVTVWGSGTQGRAFIHVDDIVQAFISCLEVSDLPDFIQIGPAKCTEIRELIEILIKISGKNNIKVNFDKTKPEGDKGRSANCEIAQRLLNWSTQKSLEEGLKELYEWILSERRAIGM